MKIQSISATGDANADALEPFYIVARLELGDLRGRTSNRVAGFNARLLELLPRLGEHYCDYRQMGGFVEHLFDGTHFNHVVEHIAVELLAEAGAAARNRKICGKDESDDSNVVIETTTVETTRCILPLAVEIADSIVRETSFSIVEKIGEAKIIAARCEQEVV